MIRETEPDETGGAAWRYAAPEAWARGLAADRPNQRGRGTVYAPAIFSSPAGPQILVVRQPDRTIKAFHNACRHRATQLRKGSGRVDSRLQEAAGRLAAGIGLGRVDA